MCEGNSYCKVGVKVYSEARMESAVKLRVERKDSEYEGAV